jgi:hypothetical protein
MEPIRDRGPIEEDVRRALAAQPVTDLHTHCYSPRFGFSPRPSGLLLWGIDELLTYHYLVAELFRAMPDLEPRRFWEMAKGEQADLIWRKLFRESTPLSEACRGVVTTLTALGLDPNERDLTRYRTWFLGQDPDHYVDRVMHLAHVDWITMTNPVFDDHERELWLREPTVGEDRRFRAVLRIDPLLLEWPEAARKLSSWEYKVAEDFSAETVQEAQRFLREWIDRMKAVYVAVSLPPEFSYSSSGASTGPVARILSGIVLPVLEAEGLPFAMMIGVKRQVNPALREAGDAVGRAGVDSVMNLCRDFPKNRFLVTMLSREDQHELCVAARKFPNLLVFGCWWFLNNPSLVEEITRMRLELLGTRFVPQHSDARILDQLIYKWDHARAVLHTVLTDRYHDLARSGFRLEKEHIARDVKLLLRDNFRGFIERR